MESVEIIKELCKQIATLEQNNNFLQNELIKVTKYKDELVKDCHNLSYDLQLLRDELKNFK